MAQRWGTGSRCSTFSDLACQKFDTWFYDVPHPQRFGPSPSSLLELPGSAPLFNCVFFLVCCAFCQTGLKGESSLPYTLPLVLLPLSIRPTFRRHDSMPSSLVVYTRANPFAFFIIFLFTVILATTNRKHVQCVSIVPSRLPGWNPVRLLFHRLPTVHFLLLSAAK
jgi:hypothetical protein